MVQNQLKRKPGQETFQPDTGNLSTIIIKAVGEDTSNIIQTMLNTKTIKVEFTLQEVTSR